MYVACDDVEDTNRRGLEVTFSLDELSTQRLESKGQELTLDAVKGGPLLLILRAI